MVRITSVLTATLAIVLLAGGCASGPFPIDSVHTEQRLTVADAVPVALSPADHSRVDTWIGAFGNTMKRGLATGVIWQRAFIGDPANDPQIIIKSAVLKDSLAAAGFSGRSTFTIEIEFPYHGRTYPIHAEGSRGYSMNIAQGQKQAIELGIADAAHQVKSVLQGKADVATTP